MHGWTGTILVIDLTSGRIEKMPLSKELRLNYLGGRGINVRILYDRIHPGIEGVNPENVLIYGTGPLTGTSLASGRLNITAICPGTNMLGDTNGGSHFSPELKFAGYDHIVFTGKAPQPVYLWVDNDNVELRDARDIWGKMTDETDKMIKEQLGDPRIQITCIGPAGEKLVKIAGVVIGTDGFGGRFGMGAVMGSKNLKAVAVRGTKGVKVADPEAFRTLVLSLKRKSMDNLAYQTFSKYGTTYNLLPKHIRGDIAYQNAQQTGCWDEGYAEIGHEAIYEKYSVRKKSCFGCINHCRSWFEIKEGPYAGLKGVGIEFATQMALGAINDNSYAPALYKGFILCNQYGLDQSQCGQLIAAATEWYEKGIVTKEDTQGLDLRWGNYEAMVEMCHKIANREGIGNLLAEGGVYAAKKLGKGAEKCISHIKGIMRTTGDIRGSTGYSLGLTVATRGADHLRGADGRHPFGQYEGTAKAVRKNQIITTLADALEICKFSTTYKLFISLGDMVELFYAATGMKMNEKEMTEVADRIWNLERAMIVREGITRRDDAIVGRYKDEAICGGPLDGLTFDREKWDEMLNEYYDLNEWDKNTGIPTRAKLETLGLKDVADELAKIGKLPG